MIPAERLTAFDVETWGSEDLFALQPFRLAQGTAWLTTCAVAYWEGDQIVTEGLYRPAPDQLSGWLDAVIEADHYMVCWNAPFDVAWLLAMDKTHPHLGLRDKVYRVRWLDCMLLYRHMINAPRYKPEGRVSLSLKAAVTTYIPMMAGYEDDVTFDPQTRAEWEKLFTYNQRDSRFTLHLAMHFLAHLPRETVRAALIEAACIPMVAESYVEGLNINVEQAAKMGKLMDDQRRLAFVKLKMAHPNDIDEKVLGSPTKLRKLLFETWGLTPVTYTDTDEYSTDKETLLTLGLEDPRAQLVHEFREGTYLKAKFSTGLLGADVVDPKTQEPVHVVGSVEYNGDGRTRPQARIFGTYCVPGDVEVLTRDGWVRLDAWAGGDIAQVRPDRSIEFLPAQQFVGPITNDWRRVNTSALDCMFTPGHTMPYLAQRSENWRTVKAGEMTPGTAYDLPVAGILQGSSPWSEAQLRVVAMTQADGGFSRGGKRLRFTFKKTRKIERCRQLLAAAAIRFRENVYPSYPDRTEITVEARDLPTWLTPDVKIYGSWLLSAGNLLPAIVDEARHWDGSVKDAGVVFSSQHRESAEWLATAAALSGRKASRVSRDGPVWTCRYSLGRAVRTVRPARHMTVDGSPRRAYCAVTETGFWLARSNGCIFVTGNTGRMTYSSKVGRGVAEKPSGCAIHQWKRGAEYRSIIEPPEGYDLIELDFAGQEFRWMAVLSGDAIMLGLCEPGEDPHSFMAARCVPGWAYEALREANAGGDKAAKAVRQLGKVANLCIAAGTKVLTDRGVSSIEHVRADDLVWDGAEFVRHDGVSFSGLLPVITHDGVTGTPDHKVLVDGAWRKLEEAARYDWRIEPALGTGWACRSRSALRIVGGVVRRAVSEMWCALRPGTLRLRHAAGCEPSYGGNGSVGPVQAMRHAATSRASGASDLRDDGGPKATEARGGLVPALRQPAVVSVSELRSAWDRVSFFFGEGRRPVGEGEPAAPDVRQARHRSPRQRWSLRAWQLALGYARREPRQPAVLPCYDIVNCGPRRRFAANGVIVHNSLQYRTYPKTLMSVAAIQHNVKLTLEEATAIHATYLSTYRGVRKYWKRQIAFARNYHYVETLAGRRVMLGHPDTWTWTDDKGVHQDWKWGHESTAINFPIQGVGGDQKYLALLCAKTLLARFDARFFMELHDGVFFVAPKAKAMACGLALRGLLSNLPYQRAWALPDPLPTQFPVDLKIGPSWGGLKEVH